MCGIAGKVCSDAEHAGAESAVRAMSATLAHRGPDDEGCYAAGPLRLGHRRLAILDISPAGHQPMATPDGRFQLTFNGEIYNYLELRDELSRHGCVFRSLTDTEVLLHALVHWGPAALRRLVGMFAFALLDTERRTLLMARDFFGIKPLYYVRTDRLFAFASEIKSLLKLPGVRRHAQPQRLFEYLRFGRTDDGGRTLFADIRQLPAGHCLTVSLDEPHGAEPVRYWNLNVRERIDVSLDEAADRVRTLFLDSIRLHLRSDVPVGAALSGGIDSSSILAAMRCVAPHAELHAFSYIAADPELNEERWVDVAGAAAGARVHKIHAVPDELLADLDALIYAQDEPFGSTSIYAQYRVFRAARAAGVTVMLDGQGADELFAGYGMYRAGRLASMLRGGRWSAALRFARGHPGMLSLVLQALHRLAPRRIAEFAYRAFVWRSAPWLKRGWFAARGVDGPATSPARRGSADCLRAQLYETLFASSIPMLLRYEDRNSMAASIESRVPFLTPALAEYVLRLPESYLLADDGTTKTVFRRAMRGIAPDAILDRRDKIGFATPEQSWLTTLRPWVTATLVSDRARAIAAVDHAAIRSDWEQVLSGRQPFDFRVWRWVNLIRWADRFDVEFN